MYDNIYYRDNIEIENYDGCTNGPQLSVYFYFELQSRHQDHHEEYSTETLGYPKEGKGYPKGGKKFSSHHQQNDYSP